MRVDALVPGLLAIAAVSVATPAIAARPPEYSMLPPGKGREVQVRVCSQCHSPERPADKRGDLRGFRTLVDRMIRNGALATPAEAEVIAQYLANAFPYSKPLPSYEAPSPAPDNTAKKR